MHDVLCCEKCAAVIQILENNLVGIVNKHTLVLAGFGGVTALAVNRNDNRDVVPLANDKVISTKARSGMNTAGTGIERYMVTGDNQRITVEQRCLVLISSRSEPRTVARTSQLSMPAVFITEATSSLART